MRVERYTGDNTCHSFAGDWTTTPPSLHTAWPRGEEPFTCGALRAGGGHRHARSRRHSAREFLLSQASARDLGRGARATRQARRSSAGALLIASPSLLKPARPGRTPPRTGSRSGFKAKLIDLRMLRNISPFLRS
jgi:hypothetical protein